MKETRTPAGGPAALLAPGASWLSDRAGVAFEVPDRYHRSLEGACWALWEISRKIRARRGERGLSQFQLSIEAGVRRQTVSDLEAGTAWPDAATIARVCLALGLELGVSVPQ